MENVCNEAILWCLPLVSYQACCMQKLPGSRHHGQGLQTVKVAEFPPPCLSLEPLAYLLNLSFLPWMTSHGHRHKMGHDHLQRRRTSHQQFEEHIFLLHSSLPPDLVWDGSLKSHQGCSVVFRLQISPVILPLSNSITVLP